VLRVVFARHQRGISLLVGREENYAVMKLLAALLLMLSATAHGQNCKHTFAVVVRDELNNVRQGVGPKTLEWLQKKMVKKYPEVCYTPDVSPLVFFVSSTPAVYHGTTTTTNNGTISEPGGGVIANTQTQQAVPYEVGYQKVYLSIETKDQNGEWHVAHNFLGKTLHPTLYGLCTRNCHPEQKLLEDAIKWLHDGGLTDPKQTVLP
jgi:hypothetical protein